MTWLVLGCGYVGAHLARALRSDGEPVRVCARDGARLAPLAAIGAEVRALDLDRPGALDEAFAGLAAPIVVYSIPPRGSGGEGVRRAAEAAARAGAHRFVYLGSTGVYGDTPPDRWVDEQTPTAAADPDAAPRLADEAALASSPLHTIVLRLAAIYGPGRGLRVRLQRGDFTLTGGAHPFSRIHVDDLTGIIRAAVARAPSHALYCVADDRPTTQREYVEWLCAHLSLPLPATAPPDPSKPRHASRGRRVSNARLKRELGYTLKKPTFVEGELAEER